MNHDPGTSGNDATHPYAALSAYVDGSATRQEATTVEAHLASCAECRAETELAREGRRALQGLPALEAPGVLAEVLRLAGADVSRPAEVIELRARRRTVRWDRLAVGLGVAAVLVLGAVFVPRLVGGGEGRTGLASRGGSQAAQAPEGGGAAASRVPPVQLRRSATDYTTVSLSALAVRLQSRVNLAPFESGKAPSTPQALPAPGPSTVSGQTTSRNPAAQALSCVRASAGLPASTQVLYLEAARFEGTPVYVAAFRTQQGGARGYLVVVAATQTDCRAIHIVSRRI